MKSKIAFLLLSASFYFGIRAIDLIDPNPVKPSDCVFNTVFGEVDLDKNCTFETPTMVKSSIKEGLEWLEQAQLPDGGYGAGFHSNQREMNPHKVPADPATTAMVAMALLRTGSTLDKGTYSVQLTKATNFLLQAMEDTPPNQPITNLTGTQIQNKLGQNIDLVLASQYLTNLLDYLNENDKRYQRVFEAVNKSVDMVQTNMDEEGRAKGAGWAGVLQSAFATNALESAAAKGAWVDKDKLNKSIEYQRNNYNPVSEKAETRDGAGVMLYAVSGSARANAKEARKAKEIIQENYKAGVIDEIKVTYNNLKKIGLSEKESLSLSAANDVYDSAKLKAQDKKVMSGFGNNGGEEFLSFLQTGESLIISNDDTWTTWYDSITANLTNIQNNDGSWNGHHCITSPVFCTATCLMILSVNNDLESLLERGKQ